MIVRTSNLKTSSTSQENIVPLLGQSHHSTPVHYSSTNYLTSKQSSINNNTSIETETDNIIYTDINDIYHYKYPNEYKIAVEHKISNENNLNLINGCDIYATVNQKTKCKSKINHISNEFFDQSINKYFSTKKNNLIENVTQPYPNYLSNKHYIEKSFHKLQMNDSNEIVDSSLNSCAFKENLKNVEYNNETQSERYIFPIDTQYVYCYTLPLQKKLELSCVNSVDSYDSHYKTHESCDTLQPRKNPNFLMYCNGKKLIKKTNKRILKSSLNSKLSPKKLDHELSSIHPQFKQQKEDNTDFYIEKESWLKSSSCRDLLRESEKSKPVITFVKGFLSYNKIESPITKYDDSCHSMYLNKNHCNIAYQNFSAIIDSKVYSSSYPGSTRNNFVHHKRMCGSHLDNSGSQDDISHDSYELLEKYDQELFDKYIRSDENIRSYSIDSGNFIPSDDEFASRNQKYRSAMDVKCKSVADIMNEIWDSEDPRYFPREKLCVKSDGSFYKKVKETQDSQSSSQESRSDIYETKASHSSLCSKKSRDSLYHTDSKKSRETTKSKASLVSSGASKESLTEDLLSRNYEMPMTTGKNVKKDSKNNQYQQHSSVESKNDYYDAQEFLESDSFTSRPKVKSIGCLLSDTESLRLKGFLCENCDASSVLPSNKSNKTSKVHSISLQNVQIEKSAKLFGTKSPENINSNKNKEVHLAETSTSINEEQYMKCEDKECQTTVAFRRKSDSENIFSFDRDKIESLTSCIKQNDTDVKNKNSPEYPLTPELLSEFDKQVPKTKKVTRKEELMAKTHFGEYNPKVISNQAAQLTNVLFPLMHSHATVERTKSDPNSLANRSGICKNQRRHVLMHQKSIDLTPADSSDEDYFYKQIPSAPPQYKAFGNFEIPKNFNMIATPIDITKNGFETPKSFFHEFEYRASKVLKEEIPYVLHKRHVINDVISSPIKNKNHKPKSPKSPKSQKTPIPPNSNIKSSNKMLPDILDSVLPELGEEFLFTQNTDLSKIDPSSLEVDKLITKIEVLNQKSGLDKDIDRNLLEKLNKKLGNIESDSQTENIYNEQKRSEFSPTFKKEIITSTKLAVAKRIISKTRPVNKIKKSKTRITSFSSDDESLDSDDVFGSAEPIPSNLEFSPPQSRKEIEPILRIEQSKLISAVWGRGQTMSSTEIEGSPPQCRRLAELESRYDNLKLEPTMYSNVTELRRISERSASIPSSEEENYVSSKGICVCTRNYHRSDNIPFPIVLSNDSVHNEEEICTAYKNDKKTLKAINCTFKNNVYHKSSKTDILGLPIISWPKENVAIVLPHAYHNLSEGSGLASLQKQKYTLQSPLKYRRTKSLDIPVITMHKLPPLNAFSSKDDTIEFEEEADILEEKVLLQKINNIEEENPDSVRSCAGSIPSAQVFQSPFKRNPTLRNVNIDIEENNLLHQLAFIEKIALKGVKIKDRKKSKMELRSGHHLILDIPKYNFDYSPLNSCNSSRKTSPGVSRASSLESTGLRKSKIRSKSCDPIKLKQNPGIIISAKKEKKSLSKQIPNLIEGERRLSKENSKSQEETKAEIVKRKEKQQKLYESAMKQTITMLSPVMDKLPPFPTNEDKISVKTEGDKIIIETEFRSKAKDHVLIAKSPRKLDTSLVKFSRSFDEGGCIKKLEKANRSFEDRKKSFEDSEKSDTASDVAIEYSKAAMKSQSLEQSEAYNDTRLLDKNNVKRSLNFETEVKSEERLEKGRSAGVDRKIFANNYYLNEEIDMQAVITERRSLEILKRQSHRTEDTARDSDGSHMPSTGDSVDSYVSIDESTSDSKPSFTAEDYPHRVPTIECEEPSFDDDDNLNECRHLKVSRFSNYHLSLDRSRSDETGSWVTMECEEYIGSDISDNEPRILESYIANQGSKKDAVDLNINGSPYTSTSDQNVQKVFPDINGVLKKPLVKNFGNQKENSDPDAKQKGSFSQQSKKSKNSDASRDTAITSPKLGGERCDWSLSYSGKEKSSVEDESSVSCSIARPLGISQDFGELENKKCLELKEQMLKLDSERSSKNEKSSNPETNIVTIKKTSTAVLEKQCPVDFGTSTEVFQDDIEEIKIQTPSKNDDSTRLNSSIITPYMYKPIRKKTSKNPNMTALDVVDNLWKSGSDQSSQESKSSFDSKASLSIESKGSFETESSSGSLGLAQRRGELLQKEQQPTWKPFTMESSGSSSVEEQFPDIDHDTFEHIDHVITLKDSSENGYKELFFKGQKGSDVQCQDELFDFPTTFGYPIMTSALSGIGINPTDIVGYNPGFSTGRTLSRISERSTASEKSSIEDDVSKASTHSVSMRDESAGSTDRQPSLSSDSRSNTNMAYISDADRRTSAEMPDIPCDLAIGERLSSLSSLNGHRGSTVITGRFAVTQVDEQTPEELNRQTLFCLSNPGSQDSEDWPLPEIPYDFVPVKPTELIFLVPDLDKPIPKTFSWKGSMSFQSQDSHDWPSPSSNPGELSLSENVEPYHTPECESSAKPPIEFIDTPEWTFEDLQYNKTYIPSPEEPKVLPYADTSYFMSSTFNNESVMDDTCFSTVEYNPPTCLSSVSFLPYSFRDNCCSAFTSVSDNSLLKENISDSIIILQPTRSSKNLSPISVEDTPSNDDVFFPGTSKVHINPDESRVIKLGNTRSSNSSDTSTDALSISGVTLHDDQITVRRGFDKHLSSGCYIKCGHSSHSEEETSSICTDLDGTVRMGLQLKKCTHSSHSEDTSIGLSISEWSTGTNTVHQYANLSGSDSLSAVSNHSFGVKSEKSNHTKSSKTSFNKSSESINGKSANFSGSKKLSEENDSLDGLRYDVLSSSETEKVSDSVTKSDESTLTLTDMAQTVTEWSTSSSRTLIAGQPQISQTQENKNPRDVKNVTLLEDKKSLYPLIHNNKNSSGIENDFLNNSIKQIKENKKSQMQPSHIGGMKEIDNILSGASKKRYSLEMTSKQYQSQEIPSDREVFTEYLYLPTEKLSARYQSQEFIPLGQPSSESLLSPETFSLIEKPTLKYNSYENKSFSANKINEYKTNKLQHSHSFNEQFIIENDSISEESRKPALSTTLQTTYTALQTTSPLCNCNVKRFKPSLCYFNSVHSESPPNEIIQKPLLMVSMLRQNKKTPLSENDTDSSLDLQKQEVEVRCHGYRKKSPMPRKRIQSDNLHTEEEGMDISEMYLSEDEISKSNNSQQQQFDEEQDFELGDNNDYHPYNEFFNRLSGGTEVNSTNVDEMGFPRYNRLQQITSRIYSQPSSRESTPTAHKKPIKPTRQKKRQLNRKELVDTQDEYLEYRLQQCNQKERGFGEKSRLFINFRNANEKRIQQCVDNELPNPDFLSDYKNEEATTE